jgi:hypothetical protein
MKDIFVEIDQLVTQNLEIFHLADPMFEPAQLLNSVNLEVAIAALFSRQQRILKHQTVA